MTPGWTSADADVSIEGGRLLDELEARNASEVDAHRTAAAPSFFAATGSDPAVGLSAHVVARQRGRVVRRVNGVQKRRRSGGGVGV